jgi:hypothetical protein
VAEQSSVVEVNEDRPSADKEEASRGPGKTRGVTSRANTLTTEVVAVGGVADSAGEIMTSRSGIVILRSTSAQIGS